MPTKKDPIRAQRFAFAMAAVLAARSKDENLRAAVEALDAGSDREMAEALLGLERLAEEIEDAYRLAREALAEAAEAYGGRR